MSTPSHTQVGIDTSTTGYPEFKTVQFPVPFPEGCMVVVQAQVQTTNGNDTPGLRIQNVTTTGFEYMLNELVVSNKEGNPAHLPAGGGLRLSSGWHVSESIGWTAFAYPQD